MAMLLKKNFFSDRQFKRRTLSVAVSKKLSSPQFFCIKSYEDGGHKLKILG